MSAVRRTDTLPEMAIRRLLTDSGVHYRVKNKRLPGSPDIANRSQRWAIFVNGCFGTGTSFARSQRAIISLECLNPAPNFGQQSFERIGPEMPGRAGTFGDLVFVCS
jgi:hypothetical protein